MTATGSPELPAGSRVVATLALRGASSKADELTPIQLVGSTEQRVTLGPSENTELTFEMRAAAIGEAVLVATVREVLSNGDGAADAIELKLPVLGVQPAVTVATSMALRVASRVWPDGGSAARM